MRDTQRKNTQKRDTRIKKTLLRRKETGQQIYMLCVLHTILAYSINIGAQRDTCQTGVGRKHFCAVRHKNGKRAKVKRAKLASRQSETRRTGAASK